MFRKFIVSVGLALMLCGFSAGAASAMDSNCLWDRLSAAKRAELLENYRVSGLDSLDNLPIVDADLTGWVMHCGVTDDNAETAGALLGTVIIEKGVAASLAKDFGVTPKALADAWRAVTPEARAILRKSVQESFGDEELTRTDFDAELQMLEALGLTADQAGQEVSLYAFARMARELKGG